MATAKYTTINGQRVAVAVARDFLRMAAAFYVATGCSLLVRSAIRTRDEQFRLWNGWVRRLPGFNLALHPDSPLAYHVESNPRGPRALDLYDSGRDAGVTSIGTIRSNWLANNAHRFNFKPAGHSFNPREGWHYEWTGPNPFASAVVVGVTQGVKNAIKAIRYPKVSVATLGKIGPVHGLQMIAKAYGSYTGPIDNKWGKGSQAGFATFLRRNGYGTSVSAWLRKRWGYVGDEYQGPLMTKALRRANHQNWLALK